jgi:hypothetical protein
MNADKNSKRYRDRRTAVRRAIREEPPAKGGILAALRRSPLVGAALDFTRPNADDRKLRPVKL